MELLNSTVSSNPLIPSTFPKFPSRTTLRKNGPSRFFIPSSKKFYPNPPFSIYLPLSSPYRFRILASFRRPANRQNYLRKKLTEQQQVSRRILESNSYDYSEKSSALDTNSGVIKDVGESSGIKETELESKSKLLGESVLWNKLEGWVEQYKKDIEFWGIGRGPIFTVFKDSEGKTEKVVVNEDEILRRSGLDPLSYKEGESDFEVLTEVNSRISHAKTLARQMEDGNDVLPGNSSVAECVALGGKPGVSSLIQEDAPRRDLTSGIKSFVQEVASKPAVVSKLSRTGIMVVCGIFLISAVKRMFTIGDHRQKYTRFEKEMLRRKLKARMDKEKNMKGSVEVIDHTEPSTVPISRPQLDKQELMNNITKARKPDGTLALQHLGSQDASSVDFENKIQEIRVMAKHARELEKADTLSENSVTKDEEAWNQLSKENEMMQKSCAGENSTDELSNGYGVQTEDPSGTKAFIQSTARSKDENRFHVDVASRQNGWIESEVIDHAEPSTVPIVRPQLGKQGLMNTITKARKSDGTLALQHLSSQDGLSVYFENKIQEIRAMTKHARELEKANTSPENSSKKDEQTLNQLSKGKEIMQRSCVGENSTSQRPNGDGVQEDPNGTKMFILSTTESKDENRFHVDGASRQNGWIETSYTKGAGMPDDAECPEGDTAVEGLGLQSFNAVEVDEKSNMNINYMHKPTESSVTKRLRIIQSVEEAREYLSKKHDKREDTVEHEAKTIEKVDAVFIKPSDEEAVAATSLRVDSTDKMFHPFTLTGSQNVVQASEESSPKKADFTSINKTVNQGELNVDLGASIPSETESSLSLLPKKTETNIELSNKQNGDHKSAPHLSPSEASDPFSSSLTSSGDSSVGKKQRIPAKKIAEDINKSGGGIGLDVPITSGEKKSSNIAELGLSGNQENWIEENLHEFEPLVKKIAVGFRDNYVVAKEKPDQDMSSKIEMLKFISEQDGNDLEWMKDEKLREIVFKVRDNELAGRDPFHLMDDKEKLAFFSGLEKKVEQENAKLLNLHEWLHSNIENLDYGADGISVYDPPEKIIPRWKGPPLEEIRSIIKEKPAADNIHNSDLMKHEDREFLEQSKECPSSDGLPAAVYNHNTRHRSKPPRTPRTVIEGSDGSIRAGKKSGKEFWQHTKKWSQGFLEVYNAETDPEVKAIMKNMGKDLDRWITEKEIKEAANIMDKLPSRGQKVMKEKLAKVRREVEMFGPHAVASKYREYADEKEPDYLWWLDLPYILSIELYTEEDGNQEVGLYSLEMAADLELDPKQYHVVAFEDAGDCRNLCYIIRAHMEMLGKGNAFVVARQPKDAFREAKANGFGVSVIRKGEVQLNVDQTLEEVEELICEIGTKIYHDKIMRERSLDMSSLMKGVFGLKKPSRRRLKRKLKKPTKS